MSVSSITLRECPAYAGLSHAERHRNFSLPHSRQPHGFSLLNKVAAKFEKASISRLLCKGNKSAVLRAVVSVAVNPIKGEPIPVAGSIRPVPKRLKALFPFLANTDSFLHVIVKILMRGLCSASLKHTPPSAVNPCFIPSMFHVALIVFIKLCRTIPATISNSARSVRHNGSLLSANRTDSQKFVRPRRNLTEVYRLYSLNHTN